MHALTRLRLWLVEHLQPLEWLRGLLIASVIGALGALCTIGFRETSLLLERFAFGQSGILG